MDSCEKIVNLADDLGESSAELTIVEIVRGVDDPEIVRGVDDPEIVRRVDDCLGTPMRRSLPDPELESLEFQAASRLATYGSPDS